MEKIRLGMAGVGFRGTSLLELIVKHMPEADVVAICDSCEDRAEKARKTVENGRGVSPQVFLDYRRMLEMKDLDAVIVSTAWEAHIEVSIAAMEAGKYVGMEVGGATSLQECWELVRTSERTGIPCMMLENCCYGKNELTVLNMIKKGMFGELVHCEAGYHHDLRDEIALGPEIGHYRWRHYQGRNGDVYPTHGLGPVAKYLGINRGNRMVSLTAMASKSVGIHHWIDANRPDLKTLHPSFALGDVVTTCIKCAHGETILLNHDTSLPRPYSRGNMVQGTKGFWSEDSKQVLFDKPFEKLYGGHRATPMADMYEEHCHPLWKNYEVVGDHGGMDFLVLSAFFESVREKVQPPIDVYDAAAWMAITVCSEESIAKGSVPVAIPDFTDGKWVNRTPERPSKYATSSVYPECFE